MSKKVLFYMILDSIGIALTAFIGKYLCKMSDAVTNPWVAETTNPEDALNGNISASFSLLSSKGVSLLSSFAPKSVQNLARSWSKNLK